VAVPPTNLRELPRRRVYRERPGQNSSTRNVSLARTERDWQFSMSIPIGIGTAEGGAVRLAKNSTGSIMLCMRQPRVVAGTTRNTTAVTPPEITIPTRFSFCGWEMQFIRDTLSSTRRNNERAELFVHQNERKMMRRRAVSCPPSSFLVSSRSTSASAEVRQWYRPIPFGDMSRCRRLCPR